MAILDLSSKTIITPSVMPILYRTTAVPSTTAISSAAMASASTLGVAAGFCSKYGSSLGSYIRSLDDARDALDIPMALLSKTANGLANRIPSDSDAIEAAKNILRDTMYSGLPAIPNMTDINNMLENCGLFKLDLMAGLMSLEKFLDDFFNMFHGGITDKILEALSGLLSLAEGGVAFLINAIGDLLDKLNLKSLINTIDGLLQCLDSLCGSDVSDQINYVNRTLDDLHINSSGDFDLDKAFGNMDIHLDFKTNIKTITNFVTTTKNAVFNELEDRTNSLKGLYETIKTPSITQNKIVKSLLS